MVELHGSQALRLFLALWPTPQVRDELARLQGLWQWPCGAALVRPDRLHLTLHFLGPVPATRVPALQDALHVPFEPHELALGQGRWRVWPGGIAVLELEPAQPLLRLHAALAQALRSQDWPVERRPFRPHVTFARRAAGARAPAASPQATWHVEGGYALVRSGVGKGYETLHSYAEGGACNGR